MTIHIIGYHIFENYYFFEYLLKMQAGITFCNKSQTLGYGVDFWPRGNEECSCTPYNATCVLPIAFLLNKLFSYKYVCLL